MKYIAFVVRINFPKIRLTSSEFAFNNCVTILLKEFRLTRSFN